MSKGGCSFPTEHLKEKAMNRKLALNVITVGMVLAFAGIAPAQTTALPEQKGRTEWHYYDQFSVYVATWDVDRKKERHFRLYQFDFLPDQTQKKSELQYDVIENVPGMPTAFGWWQGEVVVGLALPHGTTGPRSIENRGIKLISEAGAEKAKLRDLPVSVTTLCGLATHPLLSNTMFATDNVRGQIVGIAGDGTPTYHAIKNHQLGQQADVALVDKDLLIMFTSNPSWQVQFLEVGMGGSIGESRSALAVEPGCLAIDPTTLSRWALSQPTNIRLFQGTKEMLPPVEFPKGGKAYDNTAGWPRPKSYRENPDGGQPIAFSNQGLLVAPVAYRNGVKIQCVDMAADLKERKWQTLFEWSLPDKIHCIFVAPKQTWQSSEKVALAP